jgi:N-acetyl-anhydromuramyl-L-alanine amidase AmpD
LCNPTAQASAHFVVAQDGRITQLVSLEDTAWCNGTSDKEADTAYYGHSSLLSVVARKVNANKYTVSIEHEGVFAMTHGVLTIKQLAATIDLIAFIRAEVKRIYGVTIPLDRAHIVGHYQITPINKPNCPGAGFQFDSIIKVLKDREAVVPAVTIEMVRKWCADEGLIGLSTKGDAPVTYDVLRWFGYKLEHRV